MLLNYDATVLGEGESKVRVKNFNYACVNLAISKGPKKMMIKLFDDIIFDCSFQFKSRGENCIYTINNMQEIIQDKEKYKKFLDFVVENNAIARGEAKAEQIEKNRRHKEYEKQRLVVFDEMNYV